MSTQSVSGLAITHHRFETERCRPASSSLSIPALYSEEKEGPGANIGIIRIKVINLYGKEVLKVLEVSLPTLRDIYEAQE